jgi:membrane-associated phospholipid phosphatase
MITNLEGSIIFDIFWTGAFRSAMPWAETLFRGITELGSDYFYMILIAIGYWTVNKRTSIITTFVLATSSTSNYWLKIIFKNPRPPVINWLPGVHVSNYSLPSAHAQNSMTIWGWLAIKIKTWWMKSLSVILIGLIGLSRVYIGVHWLSDVIIGWVFGFLLLVIIWKLEDPICSAISRYKTNLVLLCVIVFGIGVTFLTEFLSPVIVEGLETNFGPNGGLIIGLGVGLALEKRYVNFETTPRNREKWRLALRIILGLTMVFAISANLSIMLSGEVYWMCAIRYALITISVLFIWPFLFKRLNL